MQHRVDVWRAASRRRPRRARRLRAGAAAIPPRPGSGAISPCRNDLAIERFFPIRQAGDLVRLGRPAVDLLDDARAFHPEAAHETIRRDRPSRVRRRAVASSARAACAESMITPSQSKIAPKGAAACDVTAAVAARAARNFSGARRLRPRPAAASSSSCFGSSTRLDDVETVERRLHRLGQIG